MKNEATILFKDITNDVVTAIVKRCRKGQFILLICHTKSYYAKLRKMFKPELPLKRGIFTYKGIVAIVIENENYSQLKKYFDEVNNVR